MKLFIIMSTCTLALLTLQVSAAGVGAKVNYTAVSDAARKSGQLDLYEDVPTGTETLELGRYVLKCSTPFKARAYDSIPIKYTLSQPYTEGRQVAVEAVAFEDSKKAGRKALYDLAIPGDLKVKIEYLGSISADLESDKYIPLTADGLSEPSPFPPFKRDDMVRSSNVREADLVWFKFRITNTGDTVLDPEGFGGSMAEPQIHKLDESGNVLWTATPENRFLRQLNYLYPGESVEYWVNFQCPNSNPFTRWGLEHGDYRIDFRMTCRLYDHYDWLTNIWGGSEFARLQVPIKVSEKGGNSSVKAVQVDHNLGEPFPNIFSKFEEFMTSFHTYDAAATDIDRQDTLYLQVAPWTKYITVKLILTNPKEIVVARIPLQVTDETLRIKYNPNNIMVVDNNGVEEPAFLAQVMPGMRTGAIFGPFPEKHMLSRLQEMKDLGVNVIVNTAGDWHIPEIAGRKETLIHAASYKYFYDELMRKLDMTVMGWSLYPPSNEVWYECAKPLFKKEITYSKTGGGYGGRSETIDMGDPVVPEVIAAWARFNYSRWGDMWFQAKDGRIPIDIEGSWGWMRDDINCRYRIGPLAMERFRQWLKEKYRSIEKINDAWGSNYKNIGEIDPEENQGEEGDGLGTASPVYNKEEHIFHDWNQAVADWDEFRTRLRMDILGKATEIIRQTIPNAEIALRTEGANLAIKSSGTSDSMHLRHAYYSQRRNAMQFDVLRETDALHFYSDYTTLPYTEQEWRDGMREMVSNGFIPNYLPQFNDMRDIVLNPHYGRQYQRHYNLEEPSKGMLVIRLMAAYPWWKATYEEGGAPGILWEDYMCDGFATETQKRELGLLRDSFKNMERE